MTYSQAVRYLLNLGKELAAPRQARGQKFDLHNIETLAKSLGQPQRSVPCAHIAGTNGKGSTAAMLEAILRASGLRTGLYTSPHLERINERIRLNGKDIGDDDFAESFSRLSGAIEQLMASGELRAHPTYFECLTAMAFDVFSRSHLGFAVYEVGMGGRLDASNIVLPEVAIITQIDLDHEDYLGHSIAQIAQEKAGIIKPGGMVVSAAENPEARAVIAKRCAELEAVLVEIDTAYRMEVTGEDHGCFRACAREIASARHMELAPALAGQYQLRNALTAAAAARILAAKGYDIGPGHIAEGIARVTWPGRLERVQQRPDVYIDGTHNPAGARELLKFWGSEFAGRRVFVVYGAMRDKAVDEVAGLLFPRAEAVILTEPRQARAISASVLAEITGHLAARMEAVADPGAALERAMDYAAAQDIVLATGSLYLAGDLKKYWKERLPGLVASVKISTAL